MEQMDMGASAAAPPGTIPHPDHGTWEGHVLPGTFFILWSTWWLFSNFRLYFKASGGYHRPSQSPATYKTRSWYDFPYATGTLPIEPLLKVVLPFLGINAELWAGHVSYRRLYEADTGHFNKGNIQDWQHAAMYSAFVASGVVDLVGFYAAPGTLPHGTEHAFLGLALLVEGLLFGFHLKGTELDWKLHLLLVVVILLAAGVCVAEISHPHSLMLGTARAQLVLLQGIWFYQIAEILFKDNPAWDPTTHGAVMMVPFFFVMWVMFVALATFLVFVGVSVYLQRRQGYQPARGSSQISALQGLSKRVDEELWSATNGHGSQPELEISTLTNHRL